MKTKIINKEGKVEKEIALPELFSSKIREDICQKYYQAMQKIQPYGPSPLAGRQHSDSGKLKRKRHAWKSSYGRGISRVPRKIFWRRGSQFYWQGSFVVSAVGGRPGHPPKPEHFLEKKKINKKEKLIAIKSALSSTILPEYLKKRYKKLKNIEIEKELKLPLVIDSEVLKLKTKEFFLFLEKILGKAFEVAIKKKKVRAGKGKRRGRKYKENVGLLLVLGKDEEKKIKGIEVRKVNELGIEDFYPLGRLCIYTEKAIEDLKELWKEEKK